ncbi:MAG: TIGR02587 family membrane protein [Bacteroidota bacterium]|nr:TIGR02587 family membrane protein [Bacteroidota bacterium]
MIFRVCLRIMYNVRPASQSLKEYGRGAVGGLLFSLPLLYTMEVWWSGIIVPPSHLLIYFITFSILLLGYNRYAGLRKDADWEHIVIDSIEEIGLGIIISSLLLWLLGRIDFKAMDENEIANRIIIEAVTIAIGISVGTAQLGGENNKDKGKTGDEKTKHKNGLALLSEHSVLALCSGMLIGSNIAPTQEIAVIAAGLPPINILILALLSIVLTASVLFFLNFKGGKDLGDDHPVFNLVNAACLSFSLALAASAFMLWFFGRFDNNSFTPALPKRSSWDSQHRWVHQRVACY